MKTDNDMPASLACNSLLIKVKDIEKVLKGEAIIPDFDKEENKNL